MRPPHNGSRTSKAAARAIQGQAHTIRAYIYRTIKRRMQGITREGIELATNISGNTVRPRCAELIESGLIYEKGTRRTRAGRMAAVLYAREVRR